MAKRELTEAFIQEMKAEMDAAYTQLGEQLADVYWAPPPEGWKPPPLTRRDRLRIAMWKVRHVLAAPFVWVVRLLDPSQLDRGDN